MQILGPEFSKLGLVGLLNASMFFSGLCTGFAGLNYSFHRMNEGLVWLPLGRYHHKTFTTKRSPTKRSLTNGSRQMVHGGWLGLGLELGLGVKFSVRNQC